jgi:hypothetical protein
MVVDPQVNEQATHSALRSIGHDLYRRRLSSPEVTTRCLGGIEGVEEANDQGILGCNKRLSHGLRYAAIAHHVGLARELLAQYMVSLRDALLAIVNGHSSRGVDDSYLPGRSFGIGGGQFV